MIRIRAFSEIRVSVLACALAAQVFGAISAPATAQEAAAPTIRFQAYSGEGLSARVSDFSGLPVPRYSSLKFEEVNGRAGPSADYPVEWTYKRQGLPVVIVRESEDWRKIRDPEGDEVWVRSRSLSSSRTVAAIQPGAIRSDPNTRARTVVKFAAGAVMNLEACRNDWCQVEAQGRRGWVPRVQMWGAEDLPRPAALQ